MYGGRRHVDVTEVRMTSQIYSCAVMFCYDMMIVFVGLQEPDFARSLRP